MSDDNVVQFPGNPGPGDKSASSRDAGIPITLTGGPLTCHRCRVVTMPKTWVVIAHPGDRYAPICPACAVQDPLLWIWQSLCNIYDQIDDLMVAADNAEQRNIFATLITQEAPHFAQWRDDPSTTGGPA